MLLKTVDFFLCLADVKKLNLLIATAGEEPVSVYRVPPGLGHLVVVGLNGVHALASRSGVPNLDIVVFAASNAQRLERVPLAGFDVGSVVFESELVSGGRKVKNLGCAVVGARHELQTRLRKRQVVDPGFVVGFELVFLSQLVVGVHDTALFVARDDELVVVAHRDCLHGLRVPVHRARARVFEVGLCVPLNDLALRCACNQLLPVFDPLHRKQRLWLLVLALGNELRTLKHVVLPWLLEVPGIVKFAVRVMWKNSEIVLMIENPCLRQPRIVFIILKSLCVDLDCF